MTGIAYGVGAPTSYAGQAYPAISPYGGYPLSAHPFGLQTQQYVQPLQQQQLLQQLLQIVPQQLQQLIQIVPQQLQHLHNVQQQLHQLQHLLQILPQQLHQIQQLVQNLSQQVLQQPFQATQQPFGTVPSPNFAGFGAGLSQQAAGPWGFSNAGHGVQSLGVPQTSGIGPHTFGYGSQPSQLM
jgi:hypothetical protein